MRGRYTFSSPDDGGDRAGFSLNPLLVREGFHEVAFVDNGLAVADLVQGYPWGRLVRTNAQSRCSR